MHDVQNNPGIWMFLAGLGGFTAAAWVFYVLKMPALWPVMTGVMAVLIVIAERQIRKHKQSLSGAYGLYVRLAGYALAWPCGWMILAMLSGIR